MPNSSTQKKSSKPKKPKADSPPFAHKSGYWAKKCLGRFKYLGKISDDPDGKSALALWYKNREYWLEGREPPEETTEGTLTVKWAADHFFGFKSDKAESGELAPRTLDGYRKTCEFLIAALGRNRRVDDLLPGDFQKLRAKMAAKWGPVKLGNEIQTVRSIFLHAYKNRLIAKPVDMGTVFEKPSNKVLERVRDAKGDQDFTAEQIHAILQHAGKNLKAMVLLGLQAGMGNSDVAELPIEKLNLESGWLNYPRVKTSVRRRFPLWPETVEAIRVVMGDRTTGLLFIGPRGVDYTGNHRGHRVAAEMKRACKAAGLPDRAFYDLRRTFQTVAEEAGDLVAVQAIMGHKPRGDDMSAKYRQRVSDARLQAVVDHVRNWWLAGQPKAVEAK